MEALKQGKWGYHTSQQTSGPGPQRHICTIWTLTFALHWLPSSIPCLLPRLCLLYQQARNLVDPPFCPALPPNTWQPPRLVSLCLHAGSCIHVSIFISKTPGQEQELERQRAWFPLPTQPERASFVTQDNLHNFPTTRFLHLQSGAKESSHLKQLLGRFNHMVWELCVQPPAHAKGSTCKSCCWHLCLDHTINICAQLLSQFSHRSSFVRPDLGQPPTEHNDGSFSF